MTNVLIPSDNSDLVRYLASAYSRCGCQVVTGKLNFFLRLARFDMVHYLWPEEFTDWAPPDGDALVRIRDAAEWWARNSSPIILVNNLYPHGYEGHEGFKHLYELFYEQSNAIVYDSKAARALVSREFPVTTAKPSWMVTCCGYNDLRPERSDRAALRQQLGFSEQDFVVLVFGNLRMWSEIQLVMHGFERSRAARKRLLLVARFNDRFSTSAWQRRFRRCCWGAWLRFYNAVCVTHYVPDEEIYRYFQAADTVIIPRLHDLSSGVVGMGMTFGQLIIAPDHGAFPDYLAGTGNLLYKSGDPESLGGAIDKAAVADREQIRRTNLRVAAGWTWEGITKTCIEAAGLQPCHLDGR